MKTPGSGRKKGTPNKRTLDIRGIAQTYGERAVEVLVQIMNGYDGEKLAVRELRTKFGKFVPPDQKQEWHRLIKEIEDVGNVPAHARARAAESVINRGFGVPGPIQPERGDRLNEFIEALRNPAPESEASNETPKPETKSEPE